MYLAKWSEESNLDWTEYFKEVSTPRAVYDIRSAKVSPWMLYLCDTGDELLTRFSDEQVKMIEDIISAPLWMKLFTQNKEEVSEVKQACSIAGI